MIKITGKNDKKGFLLGEFTLKTIIAVLCLVLLFMLLLSIYNAFKDASTVRAESTLEEVISLMNKVPDKGTEKYILLEPKGWKFVFHENGMADCIGSCLCLHLDGGVFKKEKNVCSQAAGKVTVESDFKISGSDEPISILIKKTGNEYAIKKE